MLTMAQSEEIVFTPQWTAQAQFAGYYVAEAKGFYQEAGLNVRIKHPSASNPCINLLKEGKSQLITLHLISAMKNINKGLPLINDIELSFLYLIHLNIPIVFTCGPSLLCYRSFSCNSLTFLPIGESSTQSVVIFSRMILASFLLLSFR